jgi:hypothetical protein
MLDTLELSDFEPHVNQIIPIRFTPDVVIPATLIEAKTINSSSTLPRKPFALTFRTNQKNEYYSQAIFEIQHPLKGTLEIFLVPIGPDEAGMRYEAIFS